MEEQAKQPMREFAYLQQIERYRKQFEAFPLPAVICDRSFLVYWSNRQAKHDIPALTVPGGLAQLLSLPAMDGIWTALEKNGSFPLNPQSAGLPDRLLFFPVLDSDSAVIGAVLVAFVEDAAAVYEPARTLAGALGKELREHTGNIFRALDGLAARADVLRAGWVHAGLNQVGVESYRILRAAENISAYTRFRGGDVELTAQPIDLAEYLEEIAETVREIGNAAGIPIDFALPGSVCAVRAERSSFETALFNMLHNSLYFTRPGNNIRVALTRESDGLTLCVQDSGLGIPIEQLEGVWNAYTSFFHGGKGDGMGLGLTITRQVAVAHGAQITIQSSVGEGTAVTLRFPAVSISQPLALRQEATQRVDNRFSRLYIGLTDAIQSPYRSD